MKNYNSADRYRIDEYDAQLAMSPVKGNPFEAENFYPADGFFAEATGCPVGYSMNYFGNCIKNKRSGPTSAILGTDLEEEMSEARGQRRRIKEGGTFDKIMSYTPLGLVKKGMENRQRYAAQREQRKDMRAQAKLEQAKGQRAAGESLGKESQSDIELAKSLGAGDTSAKTPQKGMSTTTKVLIGVGVLAVLGIGAYMITRGKK
jgi:hypothetical protein